MPIALICTIELIDPEMQLVVEAETNLYLRHGFIVKRIVFPEGGEHFEFADPTLRTRIMENADSNIVQMQRLFDISPPLQAPPISRVILRGDRIVLIGHGAKSYTEFSACIFAYLCGLISKLNRIHPIHIIYMACYGRGQKGRLAELPNSAIGTIATLLHQFYTARQMPVPNVGIRPEESESEIEDLFTPMPPPLSVEAPISARLEMPRPVPEPHMISDAQAREAYDTLLLYLSTTGDYRYKTLYGETIYITSGVRDRADISCYIIEKKLNSVVRQRHPIHAIDEAGITAELFAYIDQSERERWQ